MTSQEKGLFHRIFWVICKFALFFLISCYALLTVYGYRLDVKNTTLQETGVIDIHTYPEKANVYLDDNFRLKGTPDIIQNIPIGEHTLTIQKEGFEPIQKEIVTKRDMTLIMKSYLLPEAPEQHVQSFDFLFDDFFETERYFIFTGSLQKRIGVYEKENGELFWLDTPFSFNMSRVIENNAGALLFASEEEIWKFDISSKTYESFSFPKNVKKIVPHPFNNGILFYILSNKIYRYDLQTEKSTVFHEGVVDMLIRESKLFFCDIISHNLYVLDIQNSFLQDEKSFSGFISNACPFQKIFEDNLILSAEGSLFLDAKLVGNSIQYIHPLSEKKIIYTIGRSLYLYDLESAEERFIHRLSSNVDHITNGPNEDYFFISMGDEVYFCSLEDESCRFVLKNAFSPDFLFYSQKSSELLIGNTERGYRMDFSFW